MPLRDIEFFVCNLRNDFAGKGYENVSQRSIVRIYSIILLTEKPSIKCLKLPNKIFNIHKNSKTVYRRVKILNEIKNRRNI